MGAQGLAEVWDVSAFVVQFFAPCVAIGAILPAAGVMLGSIIRAALIATGMRDAV